jgi:hypothetical protein
MDNNNFTGNTDEFAFSFSADEISAGTVQKLHAVIGGADSGLKAFAANVLIGNIPAKKVNESVGDSFKMYGYYVKNFKFKENSREGKYTVMFGTCGGEPCAYSTASDKIYEAVLKIVCVYGEPSNWQNGIDVKIRMNTADNDMKAYSLEITE